MACVKTNLALVLLSLPLLCGCSAYGRGYRSGNNMGNYSTGWHDGYEDAKGRGQKEYVRELEMKNAAILEANKHMNEVIQKLGIDTKK